MNLQARPARTWSRYDGFFGRSRVLAFSPRIGMAAFDSAHWPLISRRESRVHNGLLRLQSASRGGGRPGESYCTACRRGRRPLIVFMMKAYLNIYERTSLRQRFSTQTCEL